MTNVDQLASDLAKNAQVSEDIAKRALVLLGVEKLDSAINAANEIGRDATTARLAGITSFQPIDASQIHLSDLRLSIKGDGNTLSESSFGGCLCVEISVSV